MSMARILEPAHTNRLVLQILEQYLANKEYEVQKSPDWSQDLADQILDKINSSYASTAGLHSLTGLRVLEKMVRRFCLPFPKHYGVRLYRIGCNNRPFYLIGAMHKKVRVSSLPPYRPDEVIGSVDPMPNEHGEHIVACDLNRLSYYLGKGAKPSKLLAHYLGLVGFLPMHPKVFINAWRTREGLETRRGLRPNVHLGTEADQANSSESQPEPSAQEAAA